MQTDLKKPVCCPVCGHVTVKLYEEKEDNTLAPGEPCGVAYDETKVGCYDWQFVVIAWVCKDGHVFFVQKD